MMRILRTAGFAGLALLAAAGQAAAQTAQQKACITSEEANALFLSIAPALVRSVVETCTPILPAAAYLRARGGALAERYAGPAAAAKPAAAIAFGKLAEEAVPPEMFDIVAGAMIEGMAVGKIKPQDCGKIDRVAELLDPLPPANLAGLVALMMEFAKDDEKKAPLNICKPEG